MDEFHNVWEYQYVLLVGIDVIFQGYHFIGKF